MAEEQLEKKKKAVENRAFRSYTEDEWCRRNTVKQDSCDPWSMYVPESCGFAQVSAEESALLLGRGDFPHISAVPRVPQSCYSWIAFEGRPRSASKTDSREEPPPVGSWGGTSNPQVNPGWLELWLILKRKLSALCWASYSVPSSGFIIRTHTIMPILCIRHTHVLNSQERMGWKRHRRNQLRGQGAHPWGLCLIAPFLGMDKQLWRVMLDDEI